MATTPFKTRTAIDEEARRYEIHLDCKNDREAAKKVGIAWVNYKSWRARRGIPSQFTVLHEKEQLRRLKVWEETSCDEEAANLLGLERSVFKNWRHNHGIPSKRPVNQKGVTTYRMAVCPGCNKPRPPFKGGLKPHKRKKKGGGKETCPQRIDAAAEERAMQAGKVVGGRLEHKQTQAARLHAWETTSCDDMAADVLGISRKAFKSWRIRHGLPSKRAGGPDYFA